MNPVVKTASDGNTVFELTEEDRKELQKITLKKNIGDLEEIIMHHMCVMQAIARFTTQSHLEKPHEEWTEVVGMGETYRDWEAVGTEYDDDVVCVSEVIQAYLIELNDNAPTTRSRNMLKSVVEEVLNTCPIKRSVTTRKGYTGISDKRLPTAAYTKAEAKRAEILAKVPVTRIVAGHPGHHYAVYDDRITMKARLQAIREAAAVYHVELTADAPQSTVSTL